MALLLSVVYNVYFLSVLCSVETLPGVAAMYISSCRRFW